MKTTIKKTYIQPELTTEIPNIPLMQVDTSMPQGNGDDPIVDDEGDILSKDRKDGWGDLW